MVGIKGYRSLYNHHVLLLAGVSHSLCRIEPSCLRCKRRRLGRFLTKSRLSSLLMYDGMCCLLGMSNNSGSRNRNNYSCFHGVTLDFRDELPSPLCFLL